MALSRRDFVVLVVDDDDSIRTLIGGVLEDAGFDVRLAADGAAALELVRHERPDLMFLDIGMPVVNGIEFVRAYRETVEPPYAPIVIVSARGDAEGISRELDCDGFIDKPFSIDEVLDVADAAIRGRGQAVREHTYGQVEALQRGSMQRVRSTAGEAR